MHDGASTAFFVELSSLLLHFFLPHGTAARMSDGSSLPTTLDACHELIQQLHQQLQSREAFVEEQSHTVVALVDSRTKLSQ